MSFFSHLQEIAADPLFGLSTAFQLDKNPHKVDLSIGVYRNEALQSEVLKCVRQAEKDLVLVGQTKTYLPIDGNSAFNEGIKKILLGKTLYAKYHEEIYAGQTLGGTGALRIGADFLKEHVCNVVYLPDPTWENHSALFKRARYEIRYYPYFNTQLHKIDFEKVYAQLEKVPANSIILLHASCHNPTGFDFSSSEWKQLSQLMKEKKLFPFFDTAYQGLGLGFDQDVESVRIFLEDGHEMAIAYSCSKNFGLYGERVGSILIKAHNIKAVKLLASNIKPIMRTTYSNPPRTGAALVAHIMHEESLKKLWEEEVLQMRTRIHSIRDLLIQELKNKIPSQDFSFLSKSRGMFCYSGLPLDQVENLRNEYGIYMLSTGRISVCGLNKHNMDYVTDAIAKTIKR